MKSTLFTVAATLLLAAPAHAWNALGHKVVCAIAWQQIDQPTRGRIVDTIRRHPRFDEDFAKDLPTDASDELVFQHAGTWPDIARNIQGPDRAKYNNPTWHYVNFPTFLGPRRPLSVNLESRPQGDADNWNVQQAIAFCRSVLRSNEPPDRKALAYCWLFHLVGDIHQPLHTTALFCKRFPAGDRGGNSIKLVKGDNLHSLWDNLLGRSHKPNQVKRVVFDLRQQLELWQVDTDSPVSEWIDESRDLAKQFVYTTAVLDAVEQPGEFQPVLLPETYLRAAGGHAQARIVAAGLRLGALLGGDLGAVVAFEGDSPFESPDPSELSYWLNTNGNVRHNSTCRWFENTKHGRACTADEGRPCGICGG